MAEGTIQWTGASGKKYRYWIYKIGTSFKDSPGNYIFTKETSPDRWTPLYIGEAESLKERLSDHEKMPCVTRNGGTHVHTHISSSDANVRRAEESDLLDKWDPVCNKQ